MSDTQIERIHRKTGGWAAGLTIAVDAVRDGNITDALVENLKGQITIPQKIREKSGFAPGTDVDVIAQDGWAVIVKSRQGNEFMNWLGRGKKIGRKSVDTMIDQLRGRTDE